MRIVFEEDRAMGIFFFIFFLCKQIKSNGEIVCEMRGRTDTQTDILKCITLTLHPRSDGNNVLVSDCLQYLYWIHQSCETCAGTMFYKCCTHRDELGVNLHVRRLAVAVICSASTSTVEYPVAPVSHLICAVEAIRLKP